MTFLEDLAKRLMAVYAVKASVVDCEHAGLVLKRVETGWVL